MSVGNGVTAVSVRFDVVMTDVSYVKVSVSGGCDEGVFGECPLGPHVVHPCDSDGNKTRPPWTGRVVYCCLVVGGRFVMVGW